MSLIIHEPHPDGTWEECMLDNCKLIYKRHQVGHKRYDLGDKLGVCPICFFNKKMENGTVPKNKDVAIDGFVHHKSNDAKPESGSL